MQKCACTGAPWPLAFFLPDFGGILLEQKEPERELTVLCPVVTPEYRNGTQVRVLPHIECHFMGSVQCEVDAMHHHFGGRLLWYEIWYYTKRLRVITLSSVPGFADRLSLPRLLDQTKYSNCA